MAVEFDLLHGTLSLLVDVWTPQKEG
jgi:hypothetical protein